jgi:hypothetical protein
VGTIHPPKRSLKVLLNRGLANIAKHVAFTRCGELNVYGMVYVQIGALEGELFSGVTVL